MKTMCSPGYQNIFFLGTHALEHMIYCYTLLVTMNQKVLNKISKEHNISGHKRSTRHRVRKSNRSKMSVIYMELRTKCALSVIRLSPQWLCGKTLFFHWYQQCVTVHHVPKCMSCHKAIVIITGRAHRFRDCI